MKTEIDENTIISDISDTATTTTTTTTNTDIKKTVDTGSQALNSSDATNKTNPIKGTRSIGYNKYIGSVWKQESVPGCSPNLKLSRLYKILFVLGIPLLAIGIYLWTIKNAHPVYVFDYTDCKSSTGSSLCANVILSQPFDNRSCTCVFKIHITDHIHGKVLISYRLENFHQNLRRYRESRDEKQLVSPFKKPNVPNCLAPKHPVKSCNEKYSYSHKKVIYPCGQIPNSMFSDRIISLSKNGVKLKLHRHRTKKSKGFKDEFKNPRLKYTDINFTQRFSKPIAWSNKFWETFWLADGVQSADFHSWMKISALHNFAKPFRYFNGNISECLSQGVRKGICRGYYLLEIQYNFDVKSIRGRKKIEITSDNSVIEDRSGFLAIACTTVGSVSLLLGFFSLINFLCSTSKRANKSKTSYSSSEFAIRVEVVEETKAVDTAEDTSAAAPTVKEKETAIFLKITDDEIPDTPNDPNAAKA